MKKLNFGCGSIQPDDWANVDIEDFGQDYIGSTELFKDNTFDIAVAHCTIQIVPYHDLVGVLKDLNRIIKSGGTLRISLPDIISGFKAWQRRDINFFPNGEDNIEDRFSAWLTWYSTTRTLLTADALRNKLKEAGFSRVVMGSYKKSPLSTGEIYELDTRKGECYFMEATK